MSKFEDRRAHNLVRSMRWRHALAGASVLAIGLAQPALAQSANTADTANDDQIIVTGIRGSLQRNLDAKRDAPGVVDVISAEDIGKFPDSNVASALQRLPGLSIQRSGSRGEATGVSIRGFGGAFVATLNDGRRVATATGNRGVDFTTIGADFVGSLSVYKTPDVALSSSAIGGTIDIGLPKPFDSPGFQFAASASGSLQSRDGSVRPTGGVLVSNTFADDTIGILADLTYSRRDSVSNTVGTVGWIGTNLYPCQRTAACTTPDFTPSLKETRPTWFPQRIHGQQDFNNDERIDGRIAFQWQPSDAILLTIDDNYSQQTLDNGTSAYAAWFNGTDLRNVKTDANGTVTDFTQFGTPNDFTAARGHNVYETNQIGANLAWEVVDHLTLNLDAAHARSTRNPGNNGRADTMFLGYGGTNPGGPFVSPPCTFPVGATPSTPPTSCSTYNTVLGANTGVTILGPSSGFLPQIHDYGPAGNQANFGNTAFIGSHVIVRGAPYNTDRLTQFRGSLDWEGDRLTASLGGQYVRDVLHSESTGTFTNGVFASRSGYGPLSGRPGGLSGGLTTLPASVYQGEISTAGFIPGYEGTMAPKILVFDPYAVFSLLEANGGSSVAPTFNPGSLLDVNERTYGLWFKVGFEDEIADMPFHISAGIRNEGTSVRTEALGRQVLSLTRPPGDPTLIEAVYSASTTITGTNSYNFLLPSLDARLEVTDDLVVRLDASRTLTRPELADLRPTVNLGTLRIGTLSATGGNPKLMPYLSDNYDAAVEWYYQQNSYFAVNAFLKHITDFIVGGVSVQTINNVIDPTTGQVARFNVNSRVNGPEATVRGVEIAWQHVFGDSGFGFNANATIPSTNRDFDASDISGTGFSITGLGKSANFVGFYDKDGFQIRAAVNWRDEYLLALGQGSGGFFGAEPVYVDAQLQVDASASYDFTDQFTVFGEVTNINNSTYSTHGRFRNQPLDIWSYGRRFTAGVRFHY